MSAEDPPFWDPQRQRDALGPFQRLRAILWQRSVELYEAWHLNSSDWYRGLKREHKRAFMGVDPHASARLGGANDIFGETPVLTVWHLLRWTESALGSVPEPFVDLGAGRGVPSLVAACLGFDAIGYERETSWVERAREVAVELRLEAHFEAVDFLTAAWPDAGTFYATTTSWDRDQKEAMVERLGRGEGPRAVLLLDGPTLTGDFDQYWSRTVPVGWGRARADLWHRQGCPVKPRNDA